jgi:hypothetical protein
MEFPRSTKRRANWARQAAIYMARVRSDEEPATATSSGRPISGPCLETHRAWDGIKAFYRRALGQTQRQNSGEPAESLLPDIGTRDTAAVRDMQMLPVASRTRRQPD